MTLALRYRATERRWAREVLRRLTPDQRERYEAACHEERELRFNGKLYDDAKAKIAERILWEDYQRDVR
jgi:hypothetical protein